MSMDVDHPEDDQRWDRMAELSADGHSKDVGLQEFP